MKFKANTRRPAIEYEKELVHYWKQQRTFEKSVEQRPKDQAYVFYDGPPFITGVPHHGTLLSSIVKDAVPRYWTMKGRRVERVWGWDCHGLPAEVYTERKLGIKNKEDVYKLGLEKYILACRENMVQTGSEWEDTIARIGRWVDFKGAYKTMDKDYMESVWWAFKQLYEAGLVYEGEKVLLYCTRDATPISKAEVAMDNSYQEVTDPAVYVKFKLTPSSSKELSKRLGIDELYGRANLLAWTTTPWTLPANTALAVNKDQLYQIVKYDSDLYIVADELVDEVFVDEKRNKLRIKIERALEGKDLLGLSYQPLFKSRGDKAHRIYHEDYVNLDEGTGIVHSAPAYGEEDFTMAKAEGLPIISVVDDNGRYIEGEWQGQNIWEVDKEIAKTLQRRGVVWRIDYIRHSYPHCHRCGTKLMYRAHPSWFIKTSQLRQQMLEQSQPINWFPPHFKSGRWPKNIEQAPDWNFSRDRFWATALPVWKGTDQEGKEYIKVVGSYAELKELAGIELEDYHRPWIDEVTFEINGVTYRRIDKVFDSWFEAGSMPYAQFHYPFENQPQFEASFPGDFIAEYVGQIRAWFYYLHALSVGLFAKNSFKNVIVTGTIAGSDGRKMSKSYGNYTDPNELMDQYSADALRFLLLSSPLLNGEDFALQDKDVGDIHRKLAMIWNMYDFFTLYASVDGWEWGGKHQDPMPKLQNVLDRWVISRVHQLNQEIDQQMQAYNLPQALKPVLEFIDDASNWYVRRSRKRFWKSEDDEDKNLAYETLHYVLVHLAQILAPFVPFLAEELYQKLTGGESAHLLDWPIAGTVDKSLVLQMATLRKVISKGLEIRASEGIKLRQPLSKANLEASETLAPELIEIAEEELNIKKATFTLLPKEGSSGIQLETKITEELKREGMAREVIRQVQQYRKESDLQVDDRISLQLQSKDKELDQAIKEHSELISNETLATSLNDKITDSAKTITIDQAELKISLTKTVK